MEEKTQETMFMLFKTINSGHTSEFFWINYYEFFAQRQEYSPGTGEKWVNKNSRKKKLVKTIKVEFWVDREF
jgi:hypothetical protein